MGNALRVLLVGEESAGVQTLRLLAQSDCELVGVMASPQKTTVAGTTTWQFAERMGYRKWPADLVKDRQFAETVRAARVDLLLNVHSLNVIAPEVLDAVLIGGFNLHPGPLPRYAGLNAPSWALYRDERTYGATVHWMVPRIDAGPIAFQEMFPIEETDTGFSLSAKCIKLGLKLIQQLLESASANREGIPRIPQDLTRREYLGRQIPNQGKLSWAHPARDVFNFVRACDYYPFGSPWQNPRSRLTRTGEQLSIVTAFLTGESCSEAPGTVGQTDALQAKVACSDEWLAVTRVMVKNHSDDAAAVLKPGDRFMEVGDDSYSELHTRSSTHLVSAKQEE